MPEELRIIGHDTNRVWAELHLPDGLESTVRAELVGAQAEVVKRALAEAGIEEPLRYDLPHQWGPVDRDTVYRLSIS